MDTWKWTGVRASHVRVLGSHLRCTKMNQNAPIYTLKVTITRQTKKFRICPQWLIWLCTWGALKQETVFWCSSCTTPWLLHDFLWLLSPFKCPLNQKIGNSIHSGQFWNTLLSLVMVSILLHFDAFWCTSCATPKPLQDLLWLLYPSRCPFNPRMDHISHSG